MVDLSMKDLLETDMKCAYNKEPDIEEYNRIMREQQKFIRELVTENLQLREKILDMVME